MYPIINHCSRFGNRLTPHGSPDEIYGNHSITFVKSVQEFTEGSFWRDGKFDVKWIKWTNTGNMQERKKRRFMSEIKPIYIVDLLAGRK